MKARSSIEIYPLGGFRIRSGPVRLNVYGYNQVWIISDEYFLATLEDKNGVVIDHAPLEFNYLTPDGKKSGEIGQSWFDSMQKPPQTENDYVRPGTTKPGPTVKIRRGDTPPTPISITLHDNKPAESEEVIKAIRKLIAMK